MIISTPGARFSGTPPQASVSFDEARNTLFARAEAVAPDRVWSAEKPDVDHFRQCSTNGAMVLYRPDKMIRFNMATGKKEWEKDLPPGPRPSNVFPGERITVVQFDDGRVAGLDGQGKLEWGFKMPNQGHHLSYGSSKITLLSSESWTNKKHYHIAISPETGEILWRQPGAVFDNPIEVAPGTHILKASGRLICVDDTTGQVSDSIEFKSYGRSLRANARAEATYVDDKSVHGVTVKDGKFEPRWTRTFDKKLGETMLAADESVLYLSTENSIQGLDPATGATRWEQPIEGERNQYGMHLTERGDLIVPNFGRLVCLTPEGQLRWAVASDSHSIRSTPRGLLSLKDNRLERLHPDTGEVMYWAELPKGASPPWLDPSGRVMVTMKDSIDLYQLPDPDKLPPPRTQVVAERSDSVVVGGIRVRKKA
ncbi:MAG: hypothetical protein AMXMBFR33_67000 [Candidatus Xenobia bacterium]